MGVLAEYGLGLVGALTMAVSLALLLEIFTWLTPVDERAELRNGNMGVAIVLGAASVAVGPVVSVAIPSHPLTR